MSKLNIVDENDNIIGEETRENIHQQGLLHREIHIWIYNNQGEILFQKRAEDKDTWPGLWDASVGGHVEKGESYEEAAIGELEEETGIKANQDSLTYITTLRKRGYDKITGAINNTIRKVYAYKYDEDDLRLEKGKATSLEFWSLDKLKNISEEDKKKFIPSMLSEKYFEIYNKIQKLL